MQKFFLFFICIVSLFAIISFIPSKVDAHVLKVDGTIGVTVHIDPDDEPVAGQQSIIFVSIKDTSGRFDEKKPGNCVCILVIQKDGKELKRLSITSGNIYNSLPNVFPKSGTYTLIVSGKPKSGSAFQMFRLPFSYYASGNDSVLVDNTNQLRLYSPYIVLGIGIVIIFLFLNPISKTKRSKS